MSRYIDADKLKDKLLLINYGDSDVFLSVMKKIDDAPSADVIDVVRCKDCRWKQGSECVRFADVRPFPDDFCSRAERKEDGEIH